MKNDVMESGIPIKLPELKTGECIRIAKQFGEDVLSDPVLKSTFDVLDAADLRNIGKECNQIISSCHRLIENRRNADRLFEGKTIPKGIQNYQRLHLQETAKRIIRSLKILRGLPVILEITGLNRPISNFYLNRVLEEKKTERATHVMKTSFIHNEREFLMDALRKYQIVDNSTAPFIERLLDKIPAEEPVNVLKPGDPLYPKTPLYLVHGLDEGMWEDPSLWDGFGGHGTGGAGGAGGAGGGGGGLGVTIHIDKGISRWMEDGISDFIEYFGHIATTAWLSGGMLYTGTRDIKEPKEYFNDLGTTLMVTGGGIAGYGVLTGGGSLFGVGVAAAGAVIYAVAEAGQVVGEALGAAYCWFGGGCGSNFVNM